MLIQVVPASQDLNKPLVGKHWKASPTTRMMELLHATGVRLGLVTNGEQWMLVNVPRGETTGFAVWYANLWEEWQLRSAAEILGLTVCDMAMRLGAFLVQACRYLSELLVEAWENIEAANRGRVVITPEGDLSTGASGEQPLPADAEERLAMARRIVADRCLYGVDKNPLAVEMAKLSLWLVTLQKDRPFTFLDHALRGLVAGCGSRSAQDLVAAAAVA